MFRPSRLLLALAAIGLAVVELVAAPSYQYPLDLIFAAVFFAGCAIASLFV